MFSLKLIVFIAACIPLIWTVSLGFFFGHCPNPIQKCLYGSGEWALVFLLFSLAVTPIRKFTQLELLRQYRRLFGLFSFFYASLHLIIYISFEQFFDWQLIYEDIVQHRRIMIGVISYLIILLLALTSSPSAIRWLGTKRWRILHRLVYPAAIGAVLHYLWLVKLDTSKPKLYGIILFILLSWRIISLARQKIAINRSIR
jgi:methionine sulfoxide reductase heme-binding subunit